MHVDRVSVQPRSQTSQYQRYGFAVRTSDREPRGTASSTADVSRPGQLDAADDGNIGLVEQRNTRKPRLAQQEDTPRQPSA